MNEKREVVVTWSTFYTWDSRLDHPNKGGIGVYCAIGHDNYDNERVYVGKAVGTDTFACRMSQHNSEHEKRQDEFLETITRNRCIMYGTLSSNDINIDNETDKIPFIEDIEKRLIRYFNEEQSKWTLVNDNKYEDCSYENSFTIVNVFPSEYCVLPESIIVTNN